ncbi:magnesium transporter NIPA-domain-containing protein [Zychaea mexicana]|uniref:magnesium transporter NIPA-domain-containing protein n=1 Tax=Zychaea mexicana TaxID=64656 RepID=UPI0022FE0D7F|nr:magnesium transporter NIPA-domain-containing protein [Zychaea mexicana]KAI9496416.1 magnesium transporter NIPA-domain-containing protein [Zychaea mexicana]
MSDLSAAAAASADDASLTYPMNNSGLYKGVGVSLAIASGIFIGTSFVFKKKGLVQSIERSGGVAGDGYAYLTSAMWWAGMVLMVIGELCNFVAYAFTQAMLVTPLGALSVVVSAILSSIFLKERLSLTGKIGCFICIVGSIVIVLHAPEEAAEDTSIETFKELVLSVGFLVYASLLILVALGLIFFAAPRWGKKNMLVYITICSVIGAISVVFTQGLGMAIVHSVTVSNQFNNYFIYIVLIIVIVTLVIEIVYLNKALNLFNTSLVTPTYYVLFTTLTIVSSIVLYRRFDATPVEIVTVVQGFFCICSGVALLQLSQRKQGTAKEQDKDVLSSSGTTRMAHGETANIMEPGPAELFPFAGITRFASTTRRQPRSSSLSIRSTISEKSYLNPRKKRATTIAGATTSSNLPVIVIDDGDNNNSTRELPVAVNNTIGIGNTNPGEDGYTRETRWKDHIPQPPIARYEPLIDHRHRKIEAAARQISITVQEPVIPVVTDIATSATRQQPQQQPASTSSSFSDRPIRNKFLQGVPFRSRSRRAQDRLNKFRAYSLGLHNSSSEDYSNLVVQPSGNSSLY